jgi:putative copper export protein
MIAGKFADKTETPLMTAWHTLSLALHLIAIALWLGGIVFFLVVIGPAVQQLEPKIAIKTMNQARIGLENMAWTAIGLIVLTGAFNLVARSQVDTASLDQVYLYTLGAKLVVFLAMAVHHCLQVFKYAPAISSLTAQLPSNTISWPEPLLSRWRRWFLLLKINAALGPVAVLLGLALVKS